MSHINNSIAPLHLAGLANTYFSGLGFQGHSLLWTLKGMDGGGCTTIDSTDMIINSTDRLILLGNPSFEPFSGNMTCIDLSSCPLYLTSVCTLRTNQSLCYDSKEDVEEDEEEPESMPDGDAPNNPWLPRPEVYP